LLVTFFLFLAGVFTLPSIPRSTVDASILFFALIGADPLGDLSPLTNAEQRRLDPLPLDSSFEPALALQRFS
jgi:hypothetical protein